LLDDDRPIPRTLLIEGCYQPEPRGLIEKPVRYTVERGRTLKIVPLGQAAAHCQALRKAVPWRVLKNRLSDAPPQV